MSHKSLFGSESYFSNTSSWKAGSPISNPLLLKAQSRQVFVGLQQSHSTAESTITIFQNILDTTIAWPNALLLCMRQVLFSEAATKGWAWCKHIAELVEHTVPLRVASGSEWTLRFHKRHGRNPETNMSHVEQVSFRQCITFREHRQLKAGSPASKPPLLKAQSMTMTMPYTQVENSRPGWERFWAYDLNLTCFPDTFPASSKYTTLISSGLRTSSSWRLNWNYTWTTCSKAGSSAWNSKKEWQEWMS